MKCRYFGNPLFESGLKEILRVDKFMYFVDNINHAWVFLHTSAPTRPSTILEEITRFNASKLSEKNRIILEKARAEDDPLVLSMTLADGKVAEKNWFYQYVNSKRGDPSFVEWISEELLAKKNRGSGAAAGGGSAVPKVDKALKKLAIQMTEKVGGIQDPMMTRAASARCNAGEGGADGGAGEGAEAGGSSSRSVGRRACAQQPKNYRDPSESGETIEESSQPLSQFEGYPDDSGAGYADERGDEEEGDEFDYSDEGGWDGGEDREERGDGVVDFASIAAGGRGVPVNAAAALMGPGEPHPDGTAAAALLSPRGGGGGGGGRWPAGGIGLRLPVAAMARSRQTSEEPLSVRGEGGGMGAGP